MPRRWGEGIKAMPSIDDFVNHRWADAKEVLRQLDPDYVREVEETVRLQDVGPQPPKVPDVERSPKRRLPTEWHTLLEDCSELVMQASILQTATDCFIADSDGGMSSVEVGKRLFYHMHSWFIHANALADWTQRVIDDTTNLLSDSKTGKEIAKRHRASVHSKVTKLVKKERNRFAHATKTSWSTNITEDNLWEGSVAAGLTPQKSHDEFIYPFMGDRAKSGMYRQFADRTGIVFDLLGEILHELEKDIAAQNAQADI